MCILVALNVLCKEQWTSPVNLGVILSTSHVVASGRASGKIVSMHHKIPTTRGVMDMCDPS